MDITLLVYRAGDCSLGRSSIFLKIMAFINGVKDAASHSAAMLPSILVLLLTLLGAFFDGTPDNSRMGRFI